MSKDTLIEDVGVGTNPLATIEMPPYSGDIGIEELSPTLQRLILEGQGSGGNGLPWGAVVRDIITKKVVATTQDQKVFTIPFEDFETVNCHLDIKINSVWINPDRYTISGREITLIDGVDAGKAVYFNCYYLAETTGDGGFIQDVDVAETPQEIIVYDGSIIDTKITTHNTSNTAHNDMRTKISTLENVYKSLNAVDLNTLAKPYQGYALNPTNSPTGASGYVIVSEYGTNYVSQIFAGRNGNLYHRICEGGSWTGWKQVASSTDITALQTRASNLENFAIQKRVIVRNQDIVTFFKNHGTQAGVYYINNDCTGTPVAGKFYIATFLRSPVGSDFSIELSEFITGDKYIASCWNESFYEWKKVATTSKINNLSLLNGWNNSYGDLSIHKNGSVCSMNFMIRGGTGVINSTIFTIPNECRPSINQTIICSSEQTGKTYIAVAQADGNFRISGIVPFPTNESIAINGTYSIA